MTNETVVFARLRAAPNQADALAVLLIEQAAAVRRAEPGCLLYRVHRATDDPDLFLFYEMYVDDAAFDAHRSSAHLAEYRSRRDGRGMVAGPADVQVFRSITE
jgi:quinol monooxygenase YgiN